MYWTYQNYDVDRLKLEEKEMNNPSSTWEKY